MISSLWTWTNSTITCVRPWRAGSGWRDWNLSPESPLMMQYRVRQHNFGIWRLLRWYIVARCSSFLWHIEPAKFSSLKMLLSFRAWAFWAEYPKPKALEVSLKMTHPSVRDFSQPDFHSRTFTAGLSQPDFHSAGTFTAGLSQPDFHSRTISDFHSHENFFSF